MAWAWAVPEYELHRVNRAGRAIVVYFATEDELTDQEHDEIDDHLLAVNNWRVSHSYPLNTFQNNLRKAARKFDIDPLIAQRIKRFSSIWLKLSRNPRMKLTQMQDVGGCRAVMTSIATVYSLVEYYISQSRIKHALVTMDDYISHPKDSGYRGVHFVYRYFSDKRKSSKYNDLKIEVQIRSRYQHAWATAVETVGTFVGQALKTSIGDTQWLRFFQLMGSVIAMREDAPTVPDTPDDPQTLLKELRKVARGLDVRERLNGYAEALRFVKNEVESAHWYLMELNPRKGELSISGFKHRQREEAEAAYASAEKRVREYGTDTVLVSVESLAALERAYPNYFADTGVFVELLSQALGGGRPRHIRNTALRAKESKQLNLFEDEPKQKRK